MNNFSVLIVGPSTEVVKEQQARLETNSLPGLQVRTKVVKNGHLDPLYGVEEKPDVLILNVTFQGEAQLQALAAKPPVLRPTILVVDKSQNPALMRLAMQIGARDYFVEPLRFDEVKALLHQIYREKITAQSPHSKGITAVINAKGGGGATCLACNLAYILANHCHLRTALLDLDLQFGSVALYLGMAVAHSLTAVLGVIDELDEVALEGYMSRHKSGLQVLAQGEDIVLPGEVSIPKLKRLLALLRGHYDQVVIDLPRLIDPITITVLEKADRIVIVLQQNLAFIRDAKRLLSILKSELEIPNQQIIAVVNRFSKQSKIQVEDIQKALGVHSLTCIPNDYQQVDNAGNLGIPLYEYARKAEVTQALLRFSMYVIGMKEEEAKPLWRRIFGFHAQAGL